jgi:protoheme IX farnesyltransferase
MTKAMAAIREWVFQAQAQSPVVSRVGAYLELTKPEITFLVVVTAVAAFLLASGGSPDYAQLVHATLAITSLSAGIAALNQYLEREIDARMRRTEARPIPSGRITPTKALLFGLVLCVVGEVYLAVALNLVSAVLGLIALGGYLFCYTPLKTRTTICTAIGAIPGAMPPLMGWAAAAGTITTEALVLFAILFLWQFPHFFAIAWMYREDYAQAGIRMLPVLDPKGALTARQIVLYTVMLVVVSLFPTALKLAGVMYLVGAILLGGYFLYFSFRALQDRTKWRAKRVLQASIIYLPLLLLLMVLNQR